MEYLKGKMNEGCILVHQLENNNEVSKGKSLTVYKGVVALVGGIERRDSLYNKGDIIYYSNYSCFTLNIRGKDYIYMGTDSIYYAE